jgi:LacI family transcriptional regulator
MRAIRSFGLEIPAGVSLVAVDDLPMLEFLTPPIATVSRDPLLIGREAARLLLGRLAGEPPATAVIPTRFDPRGSCAPPP